ncbi:PAS domain-containing protein [Hydrogenimonas cancrithermarum]|uniref:Chemotaxis protein n=1 Tax=Hydrogenimonas cancrithermarum TaxID=2993563 RepID=A0ABN6WT48_9BACT|nr:PAS domain-containing protein [Hydrogenimonas cancrithermarum]BDY12244.1 chemotaxis protein [Hydrogenimonas cancrithermarum]
MRRPAPTGTERFLKEEDFIVSKTDLKGRITYGNKMFIKISGYAESELLGAPHSILRHPDMPKIVFKLLWERIQNKQEIFAYVKNLCKDGGFYWVIANVTATIAPDGSIRDYHSVRRKPSDKAMEVIPQLYSKLLAAERSGGVEASGRILNDILNEKGVTYDEFVLGLQQ